MDKVRTRCKAALFAALVLISSVMGCVDLFAAETATDNLAATITVASNISKQDMQPYLDAFNQKYPGIQIEYNNYPILFTAQP